MPEPRDARVEVRKERCGVEAHQRQPGRQRVLERRDRLSEDVEDLAPALAPVAVAFQEQRRHAVFDLGRRAVGQRKVVGTLEVGALGGVALAALVIDEAGCRVRKGPSFRIADTRPPDSVDVEHPAVAEAYQGRVHLAREHGELLMAGRLQIRAGVGPRGQEASVLQEADAVVDESRVVDQVGKALWLRSEDRHRQSSTEG